MLMSSADPAPLFCTERDYVKTIEQNEAVYIFLVLPKYHFFSFSTALKKLQKIVTCFPEDKLSSIYPDRFHAPALNAWFLLLEHRLNLL